MLTHDHPKVIKFATLMTVYHRFVKMSIGKRKKFDSTAEALKINLMGYTQKEKQMKVELYKKITPYKDKDGVEKLGTSFYVACGDQTIAVEPVYYQKKGSNDPDRGFVARKAVLSAFADELPERTPKESLAHASANLNPNG